MMILLFSILSFGISLVVSFFSIYYFQIKEYRFDRLIAAIKEQGILYFLIPERILLPKKSIRNINISLVVGLCLLGYYSISILINSYLLSFLGPFIVLLFVSLGVVLTGIVSEKNRNKVIKQAQNKRNTSKAIFIGITGSYGKSSTKEYLHHVLSSHFKTGKTIGNYNTNIGVGMSINKNLHEDTEYFVTEMGAYKIGEIKEIADWIKPTYAIITGLSNQHLSLFGSIENLVKAKSELIQQLPQGSSVYINSDVESYKDILEFCNERKVIRYSAFDSSADIFLSSYEPLNGVTKASIKYKNEVFSLESKVKGKHNFVNLLPVIGLTYDLGVPKDHIISSISELHNPFGKLSLHKGINDIDIIYDGYSSNVAGFLSAIEVLDTFKEKDKYIVTKGIIELGKERQTSYLRLLDTASRVGSKIITSDILFKKLDSGDLVTYIKSEQAILSFVNNLSDNSVVLVEGRFSDKFVSALNIHE